MHPLAEGRRGIVSAQNLQLFDYWEGKRGAQRCPRLNDMDLMDLYRIARFVQIKDAVDDGGEFLTRYWGSGCSDAYGVESTGKLLGDVYERNVAAEIAQSYRAVLDQVCGFRAVGDITYTSERNYISYEAISLPLLGADGTVCHIIGVTDFDYKLSEDERAHIDGLS